MTQQPDNLFRDKLINHQMTAPVNAWSEIEARLDKRTDKVLWLKIAAGISFFALASILVWKFTPSQEINSTASGIEINNNSAQSQQPIENTPANNPVEESVVQSNPNSESNSIIEKKKEVRTNSTSLPKNQNEIMQSNQAVAIEVESKIEALPVIDPLLTETIDVPITDETNKSYPSVYIVYSVEEVNEKYLQPLPEDDATSVDKKTSRLQMLMGVAINIKQGDHSLADLRQKKDEIFALNFIDEKKRQQKKINEL